jgi:tryptophan 2,3-dioxygenase
MTTPSDTQGIGCPMGRGSHERPHERPHEGPSGAPIGGESLGGAPAAPATAGALTYGSYLKIPELLGLQQTLSDGPEHDETLFIVIHQVYELWFKQQLHEAGFLAKALVRNDHPTAASTLRRMLTILKTMVAQIDVLETMTPTSFTSFRSRLSNSSGFQSSQFREFEFFLGHKRDKAVTWQPEGSPERAALERRLREPSLWDAALRFFAANGLAVPQELLDRDLTQPTQSNAALQDELVRAYQTMPTVRHLCELLVDLDEGIQEWRYRHVKMVERTIGMKMGTGGSSGVDYLRSTLFRSLFPDLWEIRSRL